MKNGVFGPASGWIVGCFFIHSEESFAIIGDEYTFSPAELSSERGEKKVLADSTQLGGGTAAINAVARELLRSACLPGREKMAPECISSMTGRALLQSMLVSADDSCHCPHRPTPLLLCAPPMVCLSVSLALSLSRLYAFKNVIVFNVHNMLPIQGEQWRHPRLSASFMWVFPIIGLVGFPVFRLGDWFT